MEREAAYVQRQLVDGLCHLHRQGVVHRDLKLENILVQAECREDALAWQPRFGRGGGA